ncbi:MAG: bifunctional (p)ppGpp synthetase/guanosine-3',5'-bis(diphosphate) 3'-pyrophosphohydrolase [Deltaproteobacteria bacterium]|nr:bifunctional (p)ppGpp synthetase/guanosine-3',5'-bis(diphosphate) 3'-pyrophosphohydrolase [Deltaproteobacteria bacterium]
MVRLEEILENVSRYNPGADFDLIKKAYVFSAKVHQGQKRQSGEPYLVHPLEVASVLAGMRLDAPSIATGLLHDTVEDTLTTLPEIEQLFGKEVTALVDGVTKLSKIDFTSKEQRQAENFRKMFIAMAEDVRVILVKLADRLHNMRTLKYMTENKQMRIAQETLDIYAPIAGRLGMQEIKTELEDLSFYFLKPDIWKQIEGKTVELKKKSDKTLEEVEEVLRGKLKEYNLPTEVQSRLKHPYSTYRKMEEQKIEFEQVYDLIAFRVMVNNVQQCYEALGLIHSLWKPVPGRFKDYIGMPKANNYQSLHTTVIGKGGQRMEFQIRTREMHEMAEWGIASHWKYKEKGGVANKDEIKFRWLRQFLEWQKELMDPAEYLDTVKLDLFASDVYVFTPKGDIREFPRGSTPIDFAYSVHTDIGHRCVGARINGRIVPLRYLLKSGDTVEIITSPNHHPSKDWMKSVHTSRAKAKIRQYLRDEERERSQFLGEEILAKEFQKFGEDFSRMQKSDLFDNFLKKGGFKDKTHFLSLVGYGKVTPRQVVVSLLPPEKMVETKADGDLPLTRFFKKAVEKTRGMVRVGGHDDILVTFGRCCNPIVGDSIIGFISRGQGVKVHSLECPKVMESDPARRVEVKWDSKAKGMFSLAKVRVVCVDKPGLLAEISKSISSQGANISHASCRTTPDQKAINVFDLGVENLSHLFSVIKSLEKVKGVISVERLKGQ